MLYPTRAFLNFPLCILRTRRGTLYNLTPDVQRLLNIRMVQVNFIDFMDKQILHTQLRKKNTNFKKFLGFEDYQVYLTLYDYMNPMKNLGTTNLDSIKVFNNGYQELTIDKYNNLAAIMKPDIIVAMSENADTEQAGLTSNKRAIMKNVKFLDKTLKYFYNNKHRKIFGAIHANKFDNFLIESVKQITSRPISGLVINGFCKNESIKTRENAYNIIKGNLDRTFTKEKPIVLSSYGEPCDILHGMNYGVNTFECEYPFSLAEKGFASMYSPFEWKGQDTSTTELNINSLSEYPKNRALHINLWNEEYRTDIAPLLKNCQCHTCQNHTRAYIHYMLSCEGMTGYVLLVIHNLHVYLELFKKLNELVNNHIALYQYSRWFLATQTE